MPLKAGGTLRFFILLICLTISFPLCMQAVSEAGSEHEVSPIFPFPVESYRLDNGMEVVLIKWGEKGIMMDILVADVGTRFEKKPDEIEYAHLLEHLMFRGSKHYPISALTTIYTRYGVYEQGVTTSDFTFYYRIYPRDAFEELSKVMKDKLTALDFTHDEYKAETGAVLGEYLGSYYMPGRRLESMLYQIAYTVHPYRDVPEHLEVLRKMPENEKAVMRFYHDYYKPNNCRLVVVGDFHTGEMKRIIEEQYGPLARGKSLPEIRPEPPQEKERRAEIKYPGPVSPHLLIAYRLPSYDLDNPEVPAIDLLKELYFSESSPLYRRLVYEKKVATTVDFPSYYFNRDPGLFATLLKLRDNNDIGKAKNIFLEEVEKVRSTTCDLKTLNGIREKKRYTTLSALDSLYETAFTFMSYYFLSGDPDGINVYFKRYFTVTPEIVRDVARKYLDGDKRIVITLVEGEKKND